MNPTTIRVSDPRELLAYIPFCLGFRPRLSAVVLSLRGARGRLGLVARVDLVDLADPCTGPVVASGLASHLWRDGAEGVLLALYAEPARDENGWRGEVAAAVEHAVEAIEPMVGPVQVMVVDAESYYSYGCDEPECCPAEGWPLSDLESTQVSAQMVFEGAAVAAHREELVAVIPAPRSAVYNVRRVAQRWARRREQAIEQELVESGALSRWHLASLRAWEAAVAAVAAGAVPDSKHLGRIVVALHDTFVRDAVIMALATSPAAAREAVRSGSTQTLGAGLDAVFDAKVGARPDRAGLERWTRVLREVLAHAPGGEHAPAATLLAALAWWSGDGASASCWLELALGADPSYRFAELLCATLDAGVPPGWARRSAAQDSAVR